MKRLRETLYCVGKMEVGSREKKLGSVEDRPT